MQSDLAFEKALLVKSGEPDITPLFLTLRDLSDLHYISSILSYIDKGIPVYVLPFSRINAQMHTVQGIATRMVNMVRSVQSAGPYRIVGWSFGGMIAYEMATQLIGADQEISFLGLIESVYHHPCNGGAVEPELGVEETERFLGLVRQFGRIRDDVPRGTEAADTKLLGEESIPNLREEASVLAVPMASDNALISDLDTIFARLRGQTTAASMYAAYAIPIPIYCFASHEIIGESLALGWEMIVPGKLLRIIQVDRVSQYGTKHSCAHELGRAVSDALRNIPGYPEKVAEASYAPLFKLKSGVGRHTPTLFCVPGAGDSITVFRELADYIDNFLSMYGFEPRGLEGTLVPHSTVIAASACYLRALEKHESHGSMRLLGHSFGGWVVFEMARQLRHSGIQVESLTLLDTEAPDNDRSPFREYSRVDVIVEMIESFERMLGRSLTLQRSDFDSLNTNAQVELLHSRLVNAGIMHRRSQPDLFRGSLRTFGTALRTHYQPHEPYQGPVQLALADDERLTEDANRERHKCVIDGWRRWAPDLSHVHIPGNHLTLLKSPHVSKLVRLLRLKL